MLKQLLFSLGAILAGSLPVSAQTTDTAPKVIQTGHLRGIETRQGFAVSLRPGAISGATIVVDSRLQPYLRVEVREGILHLGFNDIPHDLQRKNLTRKAEVTVSTLEKLKVHSGSTVTGSGNFTSPGECDIDIHSGARIEGIDLAAREIEIDVHSGADILRSRMTTQEIEIEVHSGAKAAIDGTTERLKAKVYSGASAELENLDAADAKVSASSGASLRCRVRRSLEASASSGGSIRYRSAGDLLHSAVQIHTSSGGSVRQIK